MKYYIGISFICRHCFCCVEPSLANPLLLLKTLETTSRCWGSSFARCPYGDVFFADFVTCANFSNLCGKFLKTHNRYGHHISAKSCAGSWATFLSKKNSKKNRLHGFFRLRFRPKMASKFFFRLGFLGKKGMKKMSKIFFSFVAHISRN